MLGWCTCLQHHHATSNEASRDNWQAFHNQGFFSPTNLEMRLDAFCVEGNVELQHFWFFQDNKNAADLFGEVAQEVADILVQVGWDSMQDVLEDEQWTFHFCRVTMAVVFDSHLMTVLHRDNRVDNWIIFSHVECK